MIGSNAYMHFENKKLKKTDKLDKYFKKMILINYRDHSIYHLYDREINSIFIFCSININENSMLKKITAAEVFKIESFTVEFIKSFIVELINFFTNSFIKSFMTDFFSQNDKSIIKNMTSSVRAEDKKKNIVNSVIMSVMIMK